MKHNKSLFAGIAIGIAITALITASFFIWAPGLVNQAVRQIHGDGTGIQAGKPAPVFESVDISGKPVDLSDYTGQTVLIKFWSPNCKFCVEELPVVSEIYQQLEEQVVFLTIVGGGITQDELKTFVAENQIKYPVIYDDGSKIFQKYNLRSIPATYIIGSDGNVLKLIIGSQTLDEFRQEIVDCEECGITLK